MTRSILTLTFVLLAAISLLPFNNEAHLADHNLRDNNAIDTAALVAIPTAPACTGVQPLLLMPFKDGTSHKCTQGAGGTFSHNFNSTKHDVDLDNLVVGEEVVAAAPGIAYLQNDGATTGFGKHINIKHDDTYFTVYGHLSSYNVQNGQFVERGQVIGFTGCTGNCSGEHLHWGLHTGNPQTSASSSTSVTATNILTSDATTNSSFRIFTSDEFVGDLNSGHFYRSNNKSCFGGYSESFRTESCNLPVHPEGTAIRTRSDPNGTVYILRQNDAHMAALHRDGIPTEQTLWTLYQNGGLGLQDVIAIADGEMNSYPVGGTICQSGCSIKSPLPGNGRSQPPGRLITNGSEVSIVQSNGGKRQFSSQLTFSQLGYLFCNVVPASDYSSYTPVGQIVDGNPADVGGAIDEFGPNLSITSHSNNQTVTTASITLSGTASDAGRGESGISSVTVNGVRANGDTATGSGTANWSISLSLAEGSNTITVRARDASPAQNLTQTTLTIVRSSSSGCTYSLSSAGNTVGPGNGGGAFFMDTTSGCSWSASSDSTSWLTTSSSGSNDGRIDYNFTANNSTTSRTGRITVAGQVYTVTQIGIGGAGSVQFSAATYTANEGGGVVTITVTRQGGTESGTVNYLTSDGTAIGGVDYTPTSGLLLFGENQTTKTFDVQILNDTISDGNKTINLTLNNQSLSFTLGNPNTATVTIVDDDSSGSTSDIVWVEDSVPAGATVTGFGEGWNWIGSNPSPFSGSLAHQSNIVAGLHNHYFSGATQTITIGTGDKLFAYAYIDPNNVPSELMLQWNDGSVWRNAYWGADNITSVSRTFVGALPASGQWVRLEVAASVLGLEGKTVSGMAFNAYGGRVTWDRAGKTVNTTPVEIWVDDSVPAGATTTGFGEGWNWISSNPSPFSGLSAHQSNIVAGLHNHYFFGATQTLAVGTGEELFASVYIDPNNVPSELMLQWNDGSAWRNAYWGADNITSVSRTFVGPLPASGQWVQLKVAASVLGLEGKTLSGMAFNAYGGRVTWDYAGKTVSTTPEQVWVEDSVPTGATVTGFGEGWNWISSSPNPFSGSLAHQSNIVVGLHNHYFSGATQTLAVNTGEKLFCYVYLDPANLPSEVMLQWNDGSVWHNAYWGADNITSVNRTFVGPLPASAQWVRLEVAASVLGLEGKTISGMAFNAYGGRVTWDRAGKVFPTPHRP
jgi:murein DD-endopeptidase MepM/ murein hydrolase activator NlpD